MFEMKKMTTVSWVLGGLLVAGAGIGHAYASGPSGECTRDEQGSVVCVHKTEHVYTSEDGTHHVEQRQECTTVSHDVVQTPQSGVGQQGTTHIGPSVSCSSNVPAPKGFKAPVFSR
ncbi:hypothetical protein [Streptomyces sp. NPDC048106]|uniref:hypothetical protein n=1 Tax=Streptomyces sp. NPDC048106 TaxID=3155750 RepID=UPI0034535902